MTELDMGSWYEPPDEVFTCCEGPGDEVCECQDEDDGYDGPYDTWQDWLLDNE